MPISMDKALRDAAAQLIEASDTPRLDAELLMAHALGITREDVLLGRAGSAVPPEFSTLIERRLTGEPMAYITGTRDFWTITLGVAPGVLIPRPDSETLIEAALDHFGDDGPRTILDLGTGPGTLLLAALDQWPNATGIGVDSSEQAIAIARQNAQQLGLSSRASFQIGDWARGIAGPFDLILCNPPYIGLSEETGAGVAEYEPHQALFAGADGLDAYRLLADQIPPLIAPDGLAVIEIGHAQRAAVTELFSATALEIKCRQDLGGRDRALSIYLRAM